MADYVRHLVADDRWSERADFINGPTEGNSHSPTLQRYLRMLAEYRRIRPGVRGQAGATPTCSPPTS